MATPEYQVKAVFLFNFAQFVEWPADSLQQTNSPIIIGVLGRDPFGSFLDETVQGEVVNGHPLLVERFSKTKEIENCHILFIDSKLMPSFEYILETLKGKDILTVSDGTDFTQRGGMVKFYTESNKIKLQINLEAVKAANITVSSKLLRLAEIMDTK